MSTGTSVRSAQLCAAILACGVVALRVLTAQTPPVRPVHAPVPVVGRAVERLDAALTPIVAIDATLEELALGEHFGVTEGTIWVQDGSAGYLLFSDISANVIYRWNPDNRVSVFLENSGYTGDDIAHAGRRSRSERLHVNQVGSNGLALDRQGRVVICAQADRTLVRLEHDGTRTILADRFEGKRLSGPNDVIVKSDGALYITDGMAGLPDVSFRELPFNGVFLVKDGTVRALDKDPQGGFPNGIALSPDEKYLYVSANGKIVRYDVQPDDTVKNGQVFLDAGSDGIRVDRQGNLYTTTQGAVWIVSPQGKHLGTIHIPQIAGSGTTNLAFGEADGKTLFIAARSKLYRIRVNIPGALFQERR
jgi:gluconolactonase